LSGPRTETFVAPDGVELRYSLVRGGHRDVVLVVPGILTHRACREHRLLADRLSDVADVATVDVRGHGDSGGAFTFGRREPDDLAALAGHLRASYRRVAALGFSFGGFHVALAAARGRPFDAVALVAAPARLFLLDHNFLTRGLVRHLPFALRRERRLVRLSAAGLPPFAGPGRVVDRIAPTPLLIAHGTDDWLVPVAHARRLFARAGEPRELHLIERGLHAEYMLADDPEPLLGPLRAFLARCLGSG
jgi:alpha-beta hydrolase superfamily lysophospholipase